MNKSKSVESKETRIKRFQMPIEGVIIINPPTKKRKKVSNKKKK